MPSSASTRLRLNLQAPGEGNNVWGALLNSEAFQLIDDAIAGRTAFTLSGTKTLTSTNFVTNEARAAFLDITSGTGGTVTIPVYEKLYLVRNGASGDVVLTTGAGGGAADATIKPGNIQWVATDATNVYRAQERDLGSDQLSTSADPTLSVHLARKGYVDGLISTEQTARAAGDASTLAAAEAYTDATSFAAGSLPGGGSTGQYVRRIAGPSADWHDPFPQTAGGAYDGKVLTAVAGAPVWQLALPAQTSNSGKFLTTDGSNPSWALPIPAQSGNAGKFLTTNGSTASWGFAQWSEISHVTASGTSVAFTSISSSYKDVLVILEGVTLASSGSVTFAVGDGTPTYASAQTLLSSVAGITGTVCVPNIGGDYGSLQADTNASPGSSPAQASSTTVSGVWVITGGVKAVRIAANVNFTGGTIRLMGR